MKDRKTDLEKFSGAKWITQGYPADERPSMCKTAAFRRDYKLASVPDKCMLRIAAFRSCVLWINGKRIYNSGIRFFVKNVRYDTIDIAPFLKEGVNSFAVVLCAPTGSTGYSEFARAGFIMKAELSDGCCGEKICTDGSWHSVPALWYGIREHMISVPTVYQEHFNAYEKEPENWKTSEEYLTQPKAFVVGCAGVPPFKRMSPRDIPDLNESFAEPRCVWQGNDGKTADDPERNLAVTFNARRKEGRRKEMQGDLFFDSNENNLFTFDYSKTSYIRPSVRVAECTGSVRLEFYYSMALKETPDAYRAFGFECEGFADSYTPPQGASEWCALFPKGFRFMTVRVCGEGYVRFKVTSAQVSYPYGQEREIEASDEMLKKIWHTAAETLRSSTNDVIVDTCARENVLWTFDALVSGKASYYTFGELKMWKRCLRLIGEGVDEDGNFRTVVPSEDSFMKLIDQNLMWIRSCMEYYEISGDKEFAEEVTPKIHSLLKLCSECITEEKLFSPPVFAWHWVDWANIDRRPYSLPINCILIIAAEAAERLAAAADNRELTALCKELADTIRPACERFFNEAEGAFVCRTEPQGECPEYNSFGFLSEDKVTPISIHAICLACAAKCGTEDMRRASMEVIAGLIRKDPDDPRIHMGPGWAEILLSVMLDYGYADEVKAYISDKFGGAIDGGAPTFGEGFGNSEFNSAHGWGSCINSLLARYSGVFGIAFKD